MSCCINSDILTDNLGSVSDFDHHIDHILTDTPNKVRKISAAVTGRQPANGYWDSDHAGVFRQGCGSSARPAAQEAGRRGAPLEQEKARPAGAVGRAFAVVRGFDFC